MSSKRKAGQSKTGTRPTSPATTRSDTSDSMPNLPSYNQWIQLTRQQAAKPHRRQILRQPEPKVRLTFNFSIFPILPKPKLPELERLSAAMSPKSITSASRLLRLLGEPRHLPSQRQQSKRCSRPPRLSPAGQQHWNYPIGRYLRVRQALPHPPLPDLPLLTDSLSRARSIPKSGGRTSRGSWYVVAD